MEDFNTEVRSTVTAPESQDNPVFPEYDSIDDLAEQIGLAEDAGHALQPTACFEIGILLQETRNLIQSIYRSNDLCQACMADEKIENSCKEPLLYIKPDIVTCRFTESALVHGFDSSEYQTLKNTPCIRGIAHRSFEKTEFPLLSRILPLSQLQFESTLLKRSCWQAFIEDDNTRREAADILKFFIYWALERDERSLMALITEYLKSFEGPWNGVQKIPAEIEKALDRHKLLALILRRVHFALILLAADSRYEDLFLKIASIQPLIPGGMEQCGLWLQRVARRLMPVLAIQES